MQFQAQLEALAPYVPYSVLISLHKIEPLWSQTVPEYSVVLPFCLNEQRLGSLLV